VTPVDTLGAGPVLHIAGVEKTYLSLRPLRVQDLAIAAGERVALSGLDAGGGEVLVNLVTGASLPDRGEVRVLGRSTAAITAGDEWLASLDRFGIMSPRAVLLDASTVEQNLAMPFTLEIDPVPADIAATAAALARECGIGEEWLRRITGDVPPDVRARVHLARAIAHGPTLLILEHPTASLEGAARLELADCIVSVTDARQLATLVITQDDEVARRIANRVLRLEPATGAVQPVKRGWFR
jgi:ABC-type transporter Mla maintaining outer membrane lipid asymmetry ATPase subunit MlaF